MTGGDWSIWCGRRRTIPWARMRALMAPSPSAYAPLRRDISGHHAAHRLAALVDPHWRDIPERLAADYAPALADPEHPILQRIAEVGVFVLLRPEIAILLPDEMIAA